jgi:D-alanine--poly(phosphoribitol) ligase subunit 1
VRNHQYIYNLGQAFSTIASEFQDKVAIQFSPELGCTFRQINALSNQWSRYLKFKGIQSQDVIAILNEKSLSSFALMLGCLKAGIIYTNLDASSPKARLNKIIDRCNPRLIFSDIGTSIPGLDFEGSIIDSERVDLSDFSDEEFLSDFDGSFGAYIMFTSGSTGFPKGAVITHSNLLNFIQWGRETYSVQPDDVFTNANPIYFDNSVFDFYVSLFNGASVVPLSHQLVKDAKSLVSAIALNKCTFWFSVPSLLVYLLTTRVLTADTFPTIRSIAFGGEGFPKNKLLQLYHLFSNRMSIYNVYGPTECTCICSSHRVNDEDFINMNELTTLGYLAPNFRYEILSTNGNSNVGELCLIGPCVGLGYYNDSERTAQSFISRDIPFKTWMYRTGDLVERSEIGQLYFKGRLDNQIKHMGYRVELEEIEAAYASLKEVDEVGVVYQKLTAELGQIVAFIKLSDAKVNEDFLLGKIKEILPQYMVPRIQRILDVLPKNQNGKIDRNQLKQLL